MVSNAVRAIAVFRSATNVARNWDFFQFEAGARLYAGDKAADVNWMDNFHFNLHPVK